MQSIKDGVTTVVYCHGDEARQSDDTKTNSSVTISATESQITFQNGPKYAFDLVVESRSTRSLSETADCIYEEVLSDVIDSAFEGYDSTVLLRGSKGAEKDGLLFGQENKR